MPALYLFNRRTLLAGDDLQVPCIVWGAGFAAELFILLPYLLFYTVELTLTTSATPNENDDYLAEVEQEIQRMQTEECDDATSGYTDKLFCYLILAYQAGMAIFCIVSLLYEKQILQLTSLGTPTLGLELRASLGKLIERKMTLLTGVNFILLMFGLVSSLRFISPYLYCFPKFFWMGVFVLFIIQGLQCLFNITTLIALWRATPSTSNNAMDSEATFYHRHVEHHTHDDIEMAEEIWQNRCHGCCRIMAISTCFMFGGKNIVAQSADGGVEKFYGDISRALADYFHGSGSESLDVVPSDVALGFVILRHIQAQRKLLARREAIQQPNTSSIRSSPGTSLLFRRVLETNVHDESRISDPDETYQTFSRSLLTQSNPDDYATLEEGARFARHQLAAYTWILFFYQYPLSGCLRLFGRCLKAKLACSKTANSGMIQRGDSYERCASGEIGERAISGVDEMNRDHIVGDNFLHIHEATMLAHAGLNKSDIAYASFESGFYETPYFIVIDREWKSIVVSIRGSLTLEDCVVDVLLDPSPLDALGEKYGFDGSGQYCHGGVLECTNWLHADLMKHKVLDKLLLGPNAEYPDYTLRIVGHSLGAGIGVILSYMLRNTFPGLRCTCYSPPGGFITWRLAKECSEFVNTFVLDSDLVPRLSINNMERLRDEVLHLLARVKISKYDIAKRIFRLSGEVELGDLDFLLQENDDMLCPQDDIPDSEFLRQLQRFERIQQERRSNRGVARSINLYPPGRIVHLVKTGQSKNCLHGVTGCITCGLSNAGFEYTAIRKENDDFNEIEISPTLWTDHFPNRVCTEIEKVAKSFGINT
jgi:sn1-specific diacylglycerol lipase